MQNDTIVKKLEFKFPFKFRGRVGDLVYCAGPKLSYVRRYVPKSKDRELSDGELRTQGIFSEAVVFWNNLSWLDKQLYREHAIISTKRYLTGWNIFVKDYINLRKQFDKQVTQKVIFKAFEIWSYTVYFWETKAYKDFSFNKAIKTANNSI